MTAASNGYTEAPVAGYPSGTKATGRRSSGKYEASLGGDRANPQLYHDDIKAPTRGKRKRKRKEAAPEQSQEAEDPGDLDFFAPKTDLPPETEIANGNLQHAEDRTDEPPRREKKIRLMEEGECRNLLRSHRLKHTILSDLEEKRNGHSLKWDSTNKKALTKEKRQIYPQPLVWFGDLESYGIPRQVIDNLIRQGFRLPTEVQIGSLPLLLDAERAMQECSTAAGFDFTTGLDFVAVAPTGSGKTISFLIPAIGRALQRRQEAAAQQEHVLDTIVLAPTRELANQIVNEGKKLTQGTGVRVVSMKKGMRFMAEEAVKDASNGDVDSSSEEDSEDEAEEDDDDAINVEKTAGDFSADQQNSSIEKPLTKADIVVTTPRLLLNFLSGRSKSPTKRFHTVRSLVLDEADVLLDPLFIKQTLPIWHACTNPDLRISFWSATMASNIETLISRQLTSRARRLGIPSLPVVRLVIGLKDTAVPNVAHKLIYTATEQGKLLALRQLLHPASGADGGAPLRPPFLVFTQTVERAAALHAELRYDIPAEAGGSARIAVLHSALPDAQRSRTVARLRAGEVWVLIATDVLARGLDFTGLNGVVSYDVPGSAAAYVHRAGRTGRAGREGGVAVTFYTKEDIPFVKSVANVIAASERQAGQKQGGDGVQKWLLDALPDVSKADKRKLKVRGVEGRRSGGKASGITTMSAWERRKENNRKAAIESSKARKRAAAAAAGQRHETGNGDRESSVSEWAGIDD